MPLHLSPSRRQFLKVAGAALTIPAFARSSRAAGAVDEDLVAILNDTHIGEKHKAGIQHFDHLVATVDYLVKLPLKPCAVIINGDLALRDGQPGDYRVFAQLIAPLRAAGMPIHLTLGNHDARDVFYSVLSEEKNAAGPLESRHVGVVQTRHANFFLLDSLLKTMVGQGDLGQTQIRWLTGALDALPIQPAVVVAHHNPRLGGEEKHFPNGLIDSGELWNAITPRKHVKAYIHGHIHSWGLAAANDIHIVNTPAVGYVGNPQLSTTGWTMARLRPDGVTLTTLTHIPDHPWNGQMYELKWR